MSIDQAFREAGTRIEQLLKDAEITSSDRVEQIEKLINQWINAGRDDVVDHLLAMAFRKSAGNEAPDGLPLDSAIDPPAEFAKWWDYERDSAHSDINLTRSVLAAALELKEEMLRCKAAFVVENGKWYSSVIVDLTNSRDSIPKRRSLPWSGCSPG